MVSNIVFLLLSLILGGLGASSIHRYGIKFGLVDIPVDRSSHTKITPKSGGIGILLSFVLFSFYFSIDFFLWVPAFIVSIMSLFGDKYHISPKLRLCVQFACSIVFLIGLFHFKQFNPLLYIIILPVSIFLVGTTNFYNFMDGINGIAGLTAIVGFTFVGYYGLISGFETRYLLLCGVIVFSCIGFLPFNFPEAKVFMGDVGSIFLGFLFASMILFFSQTLADFILLCSFLFLYYVDGLITIVVRIKSKDNLSKPHRKHLYQLLTNELRMSHGKVSLIYALLQIIVGVSVLIFRHNIYFVILLVVCYSIFFNIWSYLIRKRVENLVGTRSPFHEN